jgi:hypothetical protein
VDVRERALRALDAARMVKAQIMQITDDADAIRDTLEGETDLDGVMRALVLSIAEDEILVTGLNALIEGFTGRRDRFDRRIEGKRDLIRLALETADWKSRELDVGTVSLRKAPAALRLTDEAAVPAAYWKPQDPKLDKKAVMAALKAGETVPGASMANGSPTLEIRRA